MLPSELLRSLCSEEERAALTQLRTGRCLCKPSLVLPLGLQLSPGLLSSLQVAGERYVYKFVCEPEALLSMAFPEQARLKAELELSEEDTLPLSHLGDISSHLPEPGSFPAQLYSKGYTY